MNDNDVRNVFKNYSACIQLFIMTKELIIRESEYTKAEVFSIS